MQVQFAIFVGSLLIFVAGCGGAATSIAPTPTQASPNEAGERLFITKGCATCHGMEAEGTAAGPALAEHTREEVVTQVRNPRGTMPAFSTAQIGDDELELIAAFIASLEATGHHHEGDSHPATEHHEAELAPDDHHHPGDAHAPDEHGHGG